MSNGIIKTKDGIMITANEIWKRIEEYEDAINNAVHNCDSTAVFFFATHLSIWNKLKKEAGI